jgi:hypothetical protein
MKSLKDKIKMNQRVKMKNIASHYLLERFRSLMVTPTQIFIYGSAYTKYPPSTMEKLDQFIPQHVLIIDDLFNTKIKESDSFIMEILSGWRVEL